MIAESIQPGVGGGGRGRGAGGLSYKADGGARRICFKGILKGAKVLFCKRGAKLLLLLRDTDRKHNLTC